MSDLMPTIVDTLLANGGEKIRRYFLAPDGGNGDSRIWDGVSKGDQLTASKWIEKFRKSASEKILDHDEPWVTLVALYSLFGNQEDLNNSQRLESINYLLSEVFGMRYDRPPPPEFDHLEGVHMEVVLPEILQYRQYVHKTVFKYGPYHLYQDQKQKLSEKLEKEKASFEAVLIWTLYSAAKTMVAIFTCLSKPNLSLTFPKT
jgi:hypothetical protein